jgi:Skp family chaperone for outer membrane proteins
MINKLFRAAAICSLSLISTTTLFCLSQRSVSAATASITTSAIGSVNIQKVLAGYTKKTAIEQSMQATAQQYNDVFKLEQASAMLSQTDQQSLSTLLLKQNRTPAVDNQIKALQTKAQNDAAELTTLQQKANPTDDDKARIAVLTNEQTNGQQALQSIADGFKQQLSDQDQQQSANLEADVRAAVASVAEQKGLAVVFDSSLAIYASNDVTAAVIAKLNGTK